MLPTSPKSSNTTFPYQFNMAKPFTLSLCLLLLASTVCLASSNRFNQCQLESLNALEPDHRVESEGGLIETYNSTHPELECAGVTVCRRTIYPNGLHLPSFSPYPQMIIIEQGKGALGLAISGCHETFEEPARSRGSHQPEDSHQKIRQFQRGDILLIPPGVPYWTYNNGDEPLVAVSLLDTSSIHNQLDQNPRVFYLAGNPDTEHPETMIQQRQKKSAGGRKHGQHQQEEDEEEGGSVLSGFSKHFLAQSLSTDEDVAERLRSPDGERKQIVKVKGGLSVVSPKWQEQEQDEEEEERHTKKKGHVGNGLEETICTLKLHENIDHPARADFYNPRAGRISTLNSLTLPVLRLYDLSAQYVVLYKNGIYVPHWNLNANSVIYVIRGQGRVRVVNCQGNAVFDGELKKGQLLVVPQNFVVAEQAGEQGFEYVEVFRAIPAEVLANAYSLRQSKVRELKYDGNWGPLVNPDSQQSNPFNVA
ncbi:Glycinin protein [Spatholobus suberectus]|nr:Glycinin protein [Spatholobus suberectus]